jgi:P27 family predicted phage terminase small subunit
MADTTTPRAPQHLSKAQRALWRHVMAEYELEPHHLKLLTLLCEALDRGEQARQAIASDGAYLPDRFGQLKAHPAVAVERDARIAAARLTRELDLDGTPDPTRARCDTLRSAWPRTRAAEMPRRRRTSKRRDELTLDRMIALTLGPTPGRGEPDDELEATYRLHRRQVLAGHPPEGRPWGFWAFEPDVPPELRGGRPGLRPVRADEREEPREHEWELTQAELERQRRDWLNTLQERPIRATTRT